MKAQIIKIGNSQGLRIPKTILSHCKLEGEVELEMHDQKLVVKPIRKPRREWEKSFKKMADRHADQLLDSPILTEWDKTEWEWK